MVIGSVSVPQKAMTVNYQASQKLLHKSQHLPNEQLLSRALLGLATSNLRDHHCDLGGKGEAQSLEIAQLRYHY